MFRHAIAIRHNKAVASIASPTFLIKTKVLDFRRFRFSSRLADSLRFFAMASVNSVTAQRFVPQIKPTRETKARFVSHVKDLSGSSLHSCYSYHKPAISGLFTQKKRKWSIRSVADEFDVIPVQSSDSTDQQDGGMVLMEREQESENLSQIGGFASEGRFSFEGGVVADFEGLASSSVSENTIAEEEDIDKLIDRAINATIVLAAGTFAVTKLLTIDSDYWQGWTLYEILRYAPQHNWIAYEEALKTNPVLAKMVISGVVYSLGDWIAQCCEGKPLFEFDRARMFRSGLVGFTFHGSLSHYYYQFCEALFPFQDWWVVPAKVIFDQTAWAAVWNSIYFVLLGFLRLESPVNIYNELKATFWPMLTAGWKLWPFAHLITYGVIPVEQRLLWVDCVELIWVTILSTYSNEKSEARSAEETSEGSPKSALTGHKE